MPVVATAENASMPGGIPPRGRGDQTHPDALAKPVRIRLD
jgi:hypothetical protein